jgi:hypothetical protein
LSRTLRDRLLSFYSTNMYIEQKMIVIGIAFEA